MKKDRPILVRPILTEKMLKQQEAEDKYGFVVSKDSNKIEIKNAVEKKFDVTVDSVKTANVLGKAKKMNTKRGITRGKRSDWKKAIVKLRKGDTIDFFEGSNA